MENALYPMIIQNAWFARMQLNSLVTPKQADQNALKVYHAPVQILQFWQLIQLMESINAYHLALMPKSSQQELAF